MNKDYGDDAFITPQEMVAESDEAKLMEYLRKVGHKELWIYTESARIEDACAKAYDVLVAKNLELEIVKSRNRGLRKALADLYVETKSKTKAKKK